MGDRDAAAHIAPYVRDGFLGCIAVVRTGHEQTALAVHIVNRQFHGQDISFVLEALDVDLQAFALYGCRSRHEASGGDDDLSGLHGSQQP